jgi:hypothetical protein
LRYRETGAPGDLADRAADLQKPDCDRAFFFFSPFFQAFLHSFLQGLLKDPCLADVAYLQHGFDLLARPIRPNTDPICFSDFQGDLISPISLFSYYSLV